jgi:hypothetical protein
MLQDIELLTGERRFESIWKTNKKPLFFDARRRARNDTHRTARMNKRVVGPAHLDQRHDLCPGKNVVRLV